MHHHGLEMLKNCLASIYNNAPDFEFEIVVVDNASTDGAVELMEDQFPQVKIIKNTARHGFGHNQNLGIQACRGEYIFIYNDDTILHGQALTKLCEFLDQNVNVGVVGPKLLNLDGSLQLSCYKFPSPKRYVFENLLLTAAFPNSTIFGDYRAWQHDTVRSVDFVIGAAMLVRKKVLDQVGVFDELFFMYFEEVDLQMRIRQAGWQIMLFPDAEITHLGGQSSEGAKDKQFCEFQRSSVKLIRKHYGITGAAVQRVSMIVGAIVRITIWSCTTMLMPKAREKANRNLFIWSRILQWWLGWGPHQGLSSQ